MRSNQPPEVSIVLQQIRYWIDWLSTGFASGQWNSIYRGRGFDFQGVAPYTDDPDLVRVNWQATLVTGELQVSQFSEERDINLYLLGNLAPSMAFGSKMTKQDRLAILAAVISFSALKLKDRFHFIGFTDQVETGFPRNRDSSYPMLLAQKIMEFDWLGKKNGGLFSAASAIASPRSLVVLISDFSGDGDDLNPLQDLRRTLELLSPRCEVIPIVLWDEREVSLPGKGFGFYPFRDLRTHELAFVVLNDKSRKKFADKALRRREMLEKTFDQYGIKPYFMIGDDDVEELMKIMLPAHGRV